MATNKYNIKNTLMIHKPYSRRIAIVIVVMLLLLIPFLAMQFTEEVKWSIMDFVVAGALLLGAGLTLEFILRKIQSTKLRIILSVALFLILFLYFQEEYLLNLLLI